MQRIGTLQRGNNNNTHTRPDSVSDQEPPSLGPDLERRATRILELLAKLEASVQDLMSLTWEQEYERRDMLEHIDDLNHLIKATVAIMKPAGSEQLSTQSMAALGRYFDQRILIEKARNWELGYQCRDLQEDLWKLQLQLRSSIPVEDVTHPPLKPRTAMEKALTVRIVELEDKIRNPKGRGRSCSI